LNASNTKTMLKHAYNANDSVLLNGKHGIGKTSVVKQFAKENNMYLETLILSLKDPSDLLGMPYIDNSETNKRTQFAEPDWFQKIIDKAWPVEFEYSDLEFNDIEFKEYIESKIDIKNIINRKDFNLLYSSYYKEPISELNLTKEQYNVSCKKSQNSILFTDELNRAFLDTRQCALQLVLEKELHSHKLPFVNGQRTFIIAAINPSDLYQTDELDIALLDRFLIIDMTVDAFDWLDYARNNINEVICSFISENPDKLHYMQKDNNGSTPRSWEQLSEYLKNPIQSNVLLEGIITGKVGKEVGSLFYVYYKNYNSILKIEDIVEKVFEIKHKSISEIASELKTFAGAIETVRKHDLINQLLLLAKDELNLESYNILTLTLISLLSSLNFEISISFCKKLKTQNKELYDKLVLADSKLNNKNFFSDLIKYSR
jgi:MoxR-like ATPase